MSGANVVVVFPDTVGKPKASSAALLGPPSGKAKQELAVF